MKVLFCASECFPFVKTGGLADVVGSLPKELLKQGCDVRVMIPKYRVIDWSYITAMEHICHYQLPFGDGSVFCGIDSLEYEGVRFYFIDNLAMFGHDGVYTGDEQEGFRYAFFCRAVLDSLPKVDITQRSRRSIRSTICGFRVSTVGTRFHPFCILTDDTSPPMGWSFTAYCRS